MTRKTPRALAFSTLTTLALATLPALAQNPMKTPRESQAASVSQTIGVTEISVSYSRPGVKKRKVFGDLVPYGEVWRAGANENTVLTASTPITVEGKPLAAGRYGVHMIPTAGDVTVAFSSQSAAWGSFGYDPKEDVLRVVVKPVEGAFTERLSYTFDDPVADGVTLALNWDRTKVPVKIGVDVKATALADLRQQLRGLPQFGWQGWQQAAGWAVANDVITDETAKWADKAVEANRNGATLRTKARLLEKKGDAAAAAATRAEAVKIANEAELNNLGYDELGAKRTDEAIRLFKMNTERYPKSWNVWDSLGEAQLAKGDKTNAKANYEKALAMTTDDVQKARIRGILAKI